MKKKIGLLVIVCIVCIISFKCTNKKKHDINNDSYSKTQYQCKTFIDFEYIFDNESLNHPFHIRENHVTNEIIILDKGNCCLYFFTHQGKFIKRVGRYGQGPGEFTYPNCLNIDKNGDIYVYDFGNDRLSILSKEGKYVDGFRFIGTSYTNFTVYDDSEIDVIFR